MNIKKNDSNLVLVSFARLPIFDVEKNLWGYELVYLPGDDKKITLKQNETITADLVASTSLAIGQMPDKGKKVMVNFSWQNLVDNIPYALPPGRTVVKIADPGPRDSLAPVLAKLKTDGYKIAINLTQTTCPPVLELADIIGMDISGMGVPDLASMCTKTAPYGSLILATRVHDQLGFDVCRRAGFSLFQGSFFKQPEDVSVKKVLSGTISKFQLMEAMEQKDPDFSKLAATIQADVSISYRLLSHLNSASFGFRQKIDSIKDAITMLGWHSLKNWLRVVLLAEVSENQNTSELIFLSAQRGKFLEQVGLDHDFWGFEPDSLSLLGMFSLLDALLNRPMREIVKHLPLVDKLKGALCMENNNEYVPFLKLAQYFEEAEFDKSEALMNQLGLDAKKVKLAYGGSIDWANKLCEMQD
jgi:EAL and modified HD-GYP domain-containing signal transduction protein